MRYTSVAIGSIILAIVLMATRFQFGLVESSWADFGELVLWLCVALTLGFRPVRRCPARFRELVLIGSMVFGTIISNVSIQYAQIKVFGRTYVASYEDPKPEPGSNEKPVIPSVPEKLANTLVSVVSEEVAYRWIILGSLLMMMSPAWAIVVSSLVFGFMHALIPIMGGLPYVGLASIGPALTIGMFCGIAFMRYGFMAAVLIHFFVNMVGLFAYNQTYIADSVIFGSAFIALIVLPLTLWLTRKKRDSTQACEVPVPDSAHG